MPLPKPDDTGVSVPGVGTLRRLYVGKRAIASDLGGMATASLASSSEAPHRLMRHLLGVDVNRRDPPCVVFLMPESYARLVRAIVTDRHGLKVRLKYAIFYDHPDFEAMRARKMVTGRDLYAQRVGYGTIQGIAAPLMAKGEKTRNRRANAWFKEGFGFLLSLELYDTAYTYTADPRESTLKIKYTRDPPQPKRRRSCLRWLREQVRAGHAVPFPELFGKSINNLHILSSLQAYSFLRFLFLHDPQGAALFPHHLAKQDAGSPAVRTDRALRAAFGKDTLELARLWRAFLEIDRGD